MRPANVDLRIEEMVLHGLAPGNRYCISDAAERELARLFAEKGVPPSVMKGGEIAELDGGALEVARDSKAEAVGTQIAQTVYRSLTQGPQASGSGRKSTQAGLGAQEDETGRRRSKEA